MIDYAAALTNQVLTGHVFGHIKNTSAGSTGEEKER